MWHGCCYVLNHVEKTTSDKGTPMKPFFSNQLNCIVVGEKCECGHAKSEHGSQIKSQLEALIRLPQEGNCCENHCVCQQYTWAGWITENEAVDHLIQSRMQPVGS